jgi:quinol-cytochrome oxidoreductase complex cytochrome b subunit
MIEQTEVFPKNSPKTYGLVELVKGTSPMVDKGPDDTVFSFPILLIMEMLLTLGTTLVLFLLSIWRDAPLEEMANPVVTPAVAKAPWYFMGLQEMLEHMHPFLAGLAIPGALTFLVIVLPYIDNDPNGAGAWLETRRQKIIAYGTAIWVLVVATIEMAIELLIEPRTMLDPYLNGIISDWVVSPLYIFVLMVVPLIAMMRGGKWTRRELVLLLFTGLMATAIFLTVVGFFFRGPGFEFYMPWNMPDGYNPLDHL